MSGGQCPHAYHQQFCTQCHPPPPPHCLHHYRLFRCIFVLCNLHFSSRFDPLSPDFESQMTALPNSSEGSTDAKRPLANIHPFSSLSSFSSSSSSSPSSYSLSSFSIFHNEHAWQEPNFRDCNTLFFGKIYIFDKLKLYQLSTWPTLNITQKIHPCFLRCRKWSCWYCQNWSGTSLLSHPMTSWSTCWGSCRRTRCRNRAPPTDSCRRTSSRKTLSGSSSTVPRNLGMCAWFSKLKRECH